MIINLLDYILTLLIIASIAGLASSAMLAIRSAYIYHRVVRPRGGVNSKAGTLTSGKQDKRMKQYIIRNGSYYFVEGRGFVGNAQNATRINESDLRATQDCLARTTGSRGVVEAAPNRSFAVNYVRPQNRSVGYSNGRTRNTVGPDSNNPSAKRFATLGEAQNHGQRNVIEQGHVGYWVTETNDPVTHYVSVKEDPKGLTCPIANK